MNSKDFLKLFDIEGSDRYFEPTILKDVDVGFSVQRYYPKSSPFVTITKSGKENDVVLIHVIVEKNEQSDVSALDQLPIRVSVSYMDRYIANHFSYNFRDDESPTEESLLAVRSLVKPLHLSFTNIIYNTSAGKFHTGKGANLVGLELLDEVYRAHCDTIKFWRRSPKALLQVPQSFAEKILMSLIVLIEKLLINLFGRELKDKNKLNTYFYGYPKESLMAAPNTDSLDVFNYKISKQMAVFASFLAIFAFWYKHTFGIKIGFLNALMNSKKLYPVCAFLVLWFLDRVVPWILLFALNGLIKTRLFIMTINAPFLVFFQKV